MELENAWYNFITENNIATEKEVNLVTDISGYSENTFLAIVYARTLDIEVMSSYWMMAIHQIMN